jgi:hypothetical protein
MSVRSSSAGAAAASAAFRRAPVRHLPPPPPSATDTLEFDEAGATFVLDDSWEWFQNTVKYYRILIFKGGEENSKEAPLADSGIQNLGHDSKTKYIRTFSLDKSVVETAKKWITRLGPNPPVEQTVRFELTLSANRSWIARMNFMGNDPTRTFLFGLKSSNFEGKGSISDKDVPLAGLVAYSRRSNMSLLIDTKGVDTGGNTPFSMIINHKETKRSKGVLGYLSEAEKIARISAVVGTAVVFWPLVALAALK